MVTEAQKRAKAKYDKANVRQLIVKFYPGDEELYEWTKSQPRIAEYLRELIRADMLARRD